MSRHTKHKKKKYDKEKKIDNKKIKETKEHVKKEKSRKETIVKKTKINTNITAIVIVLLLISLAILAYKFYPNRRSPSKNNVNVDLYVMSFCPYGTQAEEGIIPAVKELDGINLRLHFIADKNETTGSFNSLHGPDEVKEDLRQVCIIKDYPQEWIDYVGCMASNYSKLRGDTNNRWHECAIKNKINVNKIEECSGGTEGKELLNENIKDANNNHIGSSPTIFINSTQYNGSRDKDSFMRGICSIINNSLSKCDDLPAPIPVLMTILNDERCGSECNVVQLEGSLKQLIPGLTIKEIDYSTPEGEETYTKLGIQYLPAVIFNGSINNSSAYSTLSRYLEDLPNNNYLLRIKASFDPTKEICTNGIDDNNNSLIDCADADCKDTALCKYNFTNNYPTLQLFVMSYCPYGTQSMKAILPAWSEFKAKNAPADIELRFVSYTMHGDKEDAENKRLVCIREEQPDKLIPYLWCYLNASDGVGCLNKTEVDSNKLDDCVKNRYADYFKVDEELNKDYKVQGSPTFVLNGKQIRVDRSPEAIKEAICSLYDKNKEPAVCSEKFSSEAASPGFGYQTGTSGGSAGQCS